MGRWLLNWNKPHYQVLNKTFFQVLIKKGFTNKHTNTSIYILKCLKSITLLKICKQRLSINISCLSFKSYILFKFLSFFQSICSFGDSISLLTLSQIKQTKHSLIEQFNIIGLSIVKFIQNIKRFLKLFSLKQSLAQSILNFSIARNLLVSLHQMTNSFFQAAIKLELSPSFQE